MNRINANSKSKTSLSALLVLFVSLRLLWALWAEQTIAEYLYLIGCFLGFVWMVFSLFSPYKKYNSLTIAQLLSTLVWCVAMFFAYELGYHQNTVSFFGFSMDSHARIILYDFILLLPGIVFSDQYRLKIGKFFKILLFTIVATSLFLTLSAIIKDPNALRMSMSEDFYSEYTDLFYGLPDYSVIYASTLIVPWLLYKITKSSKRTKLYYFLIFISLVVIITVSQFATALLATFVGIVVYAFAYMAKRKPERMVLATFVCVFIVIGASSIAPLLQTLANNVDGAWAEKLSELSLFFSDGQATGDLGTRGDYYSLSFNQFLRSPIFGTLLTDANAIGGHSTFLDMLGLAGLFGAIPCALMISTSFKKLKLAGDSPCYRAGIWSSLSIFLIFLFTKNIISAISINYTFFVILPILFLSEEQNEQIKIADI